MSADEILDTVDEQDRVTGQARRGDIYARRLRHRCVFILATDASGRVFVHRRTPSKLTYPSHYDMFVGGVVGAGESYDHAALREAEEELGVSGLPDPEPVLKFLYVDPALGSWWSWVYRVRCEQPVRPQAEEIDWHGFLTGQEIDDRLGEGPWTPDSLDAWQRLRAAGAGQQGQRDS